MIFHTEIVNTQPREIHTEIVNSFSFTLLSNCKLKLYILEWGYTRGCETHNIVLGAAMWAIFRAAMWAIFYAEIVNTQLREIHTEIVEKEIHTEIVDISY